MDSAKILQRLNTLRDQLATAQLDVDRRDEEIQQLNEELDGKIRDHEKEIGQVEAEWRDEVLEARAQVEELKDVGTLHDIPSLLILHRFWNPVNRI